ncbi:MAG: hypothetical protein HYY84_15120 [Deltaproteobacteria bacterium]|nr:hypothetical protein [Deltaproteobacteria bacterium]
MKVGLGATIFRLAALGSFIGLCPFGCAATSGGRGTGAAGLGALRYVPADAIGVGEVDPKVLDHPLVAALLANPRVDLGGISVADLKKRVGTKPVTIFFLSGGGAGLVMQPGDGVKLPTTGPGNWEIAKEKGFLVAGSAGVTLRAMAASTRKERSPLIDALREHADKSVRFVFKGWNDIGKSIGGMIPLPREVTDAVQAIRALVVTAALGSELIVEVVAKADPASARRLAEYIQGMLQVVKLGFMLAPSDRPEVKLAKPFVEGATVSSDGDSVVLRARIPSAARP